jgi:hypothetical protein
MSSPSRRTPGRARREDGTARSRSTRSSRCSKPSSSSSLLLPLLLLLALTLVAATARVVVASSSSPPSSPPSDAADDAAGGIPVLEPGGVGDDDDGGGGPRRRVRFGERVALEELGPIIVNDDCTMRRISNWDALSARERRGVSARVVERNAARLARCREADAAGGDGDGDGGDGDGGGGGDGGVGDEAAASIGGDVERVRGDERGDDGDVASERGGREEL